VVSQRRSSASTYWHFDAIGSMRFLTAADQSKAINYVYDAFGITRSVSGSTTNRFRYIGKLGYYLEPALGCYYVRRRYYVHWLGRFLSKDPLRQGGENAYGYVNNRPTRATDPSGLWTWPGPLTCWICDIEYDSCAYACVDAYDACSWAMKQAAMGCRRACQWLPPAWQARCDQACNDAWVVGDAACWAAHSDCQLLCKLAQWNCHYALGPKLPGGVPWPQF